MKVFVVGLLIFVLALFAFTLYKGTTRFESLEGQIYISEKPHDIDLIKEVPVFLLKGRIFSKIEELENKYYDNFKDLVDRYNLLKETVFASRKKYHENKARLKTLEKMVNDDTRAYRAEIRKLSAEVKEADEILNRYQTLKDSVNVVTTEFNRRMEELIDAHLYLKTVTNEKGAFKFDKIEAYYFLLFRKREVESYMLYAMVGQMMDKHIWMVKFKIGDHNRVNLTPENQFSYFK